MAKRTRKEQRLLDAHTRDDECQLQEDIERHLEDEVRRLWKATRWYLGHEDWTFYVGFEDGDTWCGCDCNRYNRFELQQAINRLRAWRTRREYCV